MIKALSDMLADAQVPFIDWEGQRAYAIYEMPAPNMFEVDLLSSTDSPVQGLTLKVYGGILEIDGIEAKEMLLWRDAAPTKVLVKVKLESNQIATLKIWNVWRGKVGGHYVTQAWLGNSGMRVKHARSALTLRCSDGEGPTNFDDMTVRLTVID